jgi:hypothetical protein
VDREDRLSTGWAPIWIDDGDDGQTVDWAWVAGSTLDQGAFRHTIDRCLLRPFPLLVRRRTPLAELVEREGPPVAGIVAHVSRCGSTLVARMLAELPRSLVLSEAPVIDQVLRGPGSEADRARRLRALVSALAAPWADGVERNFLKLDSWSTRELAVVREAFPDAPWLFVYRDPLEVVVSQLRLRGVHAVPGLLPPELFGIEQAELLTLQPEELVARVIGSIEDAALRAMELGGGRLVCYSQLPGAVPSAVVEHLGIALEDGDRERQLAVAEFAAKTPGLFFEADSAGKQAAATPAVRAAVERYAAPAFAALERRREAAC